MKIKLFDPHVEKSEENAVKKVLQSKSWASGAGNGNVLKFVRNYHEFIRKLLEMYWDLPKVVEIYRKLLKFTIYFLKFNEIYYRFNGIYYSRIY